MSFGAIFSSLFRFWDKLESAFGAVVGQADYNEYLKHFKENHPGQTPLSKIEFYAKINDERGKRPRCC